MRSIHLLVWLLLLLPLACAAGNDPYLLTLGSSTRNTKQAPAGYTPVSINEDAALSAAVSRKGLWVPLPDGSRVHLDYRGRVMHSDGTWTFIGSVSGAFPESTALVTFGDHAVFGSVPRISAPALILTTWRGRTWLSDQRNVPSAPLPKPMAQLPSATSRSAAASIPMTTAASTGEATPSNPATVDLLVVYTPGFREEYGSTAAAITRIHQELDLLNQALKGSEVYGRIRLVHTAEVNYPDSNEDSDALTDLTNGNAPLDKVAAMRTQYGADAVTMMRAYEVPPSEGGTTWAMGMDGSPITTANAWEAFSVLDDGGDTLFTAPAGYELATELGLNFGLTYAYPSTPQGAYPFSYAYKPDPNSLYGGTLLTATSAPDSVWPYFSNPNINLCDGGPCGVANQSDAAQSLNLTLPTIAAFEPTKLPILDDVVASDIDGDGMSDLLFENPSAREFEYWLMVADIPNQPTLIGGVGLGYSVAATGDFNGDGKVDLVWSSSADDLYMWTGNGSGFASKRIGTYPAAWKVVGAADVNGDGKADLLFYNATQHLLGYWLMSGTEVQKMRNIGPVGPGYWVAGIGDFNGDGKADIVWTSNSNDLYMWVGNGTGFTSRKIGTYPAGWQVLGTGDVDGDDKSDLLFYNASLHQFSYRIMNGTTQVRSALIGPVGAGYWVAATGDYNGDGKVDIVWTSEKDDLYMWTGNGRSFASSYAGDYSADWQPIVR